MRMSARRLLSALSPQLAECQQSRTTTPLVRMTLYRKIEKYHIVKGAKGRSQHQDSQDPL